MDMVLGSQTRTVKVYCAACNALLHKYRRGDPGRPVKCSQGQIVDDRTDGNLCCPKCGQEFVRETMVYDRLATKIIRDKATIRR